MARRTSISKVLTSALPSSSSSSNRKERRRSSKEHFTPSTLRSSIRSSVSSNDSTTSTSSNLSSTANTSSSKKRNSKTRSSSFLGSMFKSSNGPSMNKLVECKDWDALLERLTTPVGQVQVQNVDFTGFTVLYDVCGKNAPMEVVRQVVKAFPEALKIKDVYSRLPLHVACGTGARVEIVRFLVKVFPKGVMQKDNKGKLALHYAVEYACEKTAADNEEECSTADMAALYGTIKALTDVKASLIHEKDDKGEDALELARRLGGGSAFSGRIIKHFHEMDRKDSMHWANSDEEEDSDDDDDCD